MAHECLGNLIVESQLFEEDEKNNSDSQHDYQNYDDNNYHNYDDDNYQSFPAAGDEDHGDAGNGNSDDEDYFDEKIHHHKKKKKKKKGDPAKRSYVRVNEVEKVKILRYIQVYFTNYIINL